MSSIDSTHASAPPRRSIRGIAVLVAALLAAGTLLTTSAGAVQPGTHGGTLASATSPAGWTPHVLDGYVDAIAEVGDTMVIGGNFTQIATAAAPNTSIARPYVFSFQKGTGQINSSFSPVVNGEVTSILPTGDGQTVWIAGGFSSLNGETVRNIAKVDLATGQRVTQFAPPALNGRVHDLQLRNGKLYLSGRFTTAGAASRPLLAAVDPLTGALDPNVRADFTDPRSGGFLTIGTSDISPDGTRMVVAGNFTKVNGQDRYQIAVLDLTTSPVSVANWQTNLYGDGCARAFLTYMRDVDFSPDGSQFAVVTTGAYNTTFLCDSAASWDAHATGTGLQPNWVNYTGGDTLTAVAFTDTAVYVGGHQRWMNNPYAGDRVGAGAVPREGLAALDPRSGATLSWNPGRARGVAVYALLATNSGLWIGSDTDRIANFQYRGRLAFMPLDPATTMPTEYTGQLPGQVVSLGLMRGFFGSVLDRTTSRQFTGTTVTGALTAEGTEDWSSLRGSFMVDGKLYTGWNDATFRVQDFNGTTFGPQSTIPLALVSGDSTSLNRFASEDLATITGMFYDAAAGRIYFTKTGSTALHYRSFSPQSRIVGGQRISSAANAGGVDWSSVQTMFMADGKLYTSSASGDLVRRDWNTTAGLPVTGTAVTVSGPGIDGQDWYARDAFVTAAAGFEPPNVEPTAAFTVSCTAGTCQMDGATSTDSDGTITSYVWDFGDGTSPGAGVTASHVYAASGTYPVTLTVTDNRGGTGTATQNVVVTVPNQLPLASFSVSCNGLDCAFDSSASSDPDGTIVAHQWNLGDGTTSTDASPNHTYGAAGTYTVAMTVTDNLGATSTSTTGVSVVDPNTTPSVVFRAAAGSSSNWISSSLTIPGSVRPGDVMILFATSNSSSASTTGPAGWTLLDAAADGTASSQTAAWTRTATAADPGAQVVVSTSTTTKTALQLVAYDGAAGVSAHGVQIDTNSTDQRVTPAVTVATPGSAVVSYWADKSGDNTGWSLPPEVTLRNQAVGVGGGRIVAAVADRGPLGAGTAGGLTATSGSVNRRGVTWSVVLAPDTGAPNGAPTASFTSSCTALTCSLDASGSTDPDGTIVAYNWTFGNGTTASGPSPTVVYGAAGTYLVSLTVTDDAGATNTTTRQLTVAPAPAGSVAFRGAASTNGNVVQSTVTVPAAVQAGDLMLLIATANNTGTTITGPAGWTPVDSASNATTDNQSHLWSRVATAGDARSAVTIGSSSYSKIATQLVAYSGAAGITAHALAFDTVNRDTHTTPVLPVGTAGSTVVSYWADKSGATTTWAIPAQVIARSLSVGSGGGRITAAIGDTGSLATGTTGGFTATADSSTRRAVVWSIVIAPSG